MRLQLQTLFKTTLMLLLLSTAILQAEDISAQEALNRVTDYKNKKDYREALKWYKKSYEDVQDYQNAINIMPLKSRQFF